MNSTLPDKLMTREELAEYLNVSVDQVDRYRKNGVIPSVKIGSLIRFRPEHIAAYLAANEEQHAPQTGEIAAANAA